MVGAAIVDDLRATLMAGFTSVRELGGYAGYLQPIVDKGFIVGPTVYSALAALSITGGHGDQVSISCKSPLPIPTKFRRLETKRLLASRLSLPGYP